MSGIQTAMPGVSITLLPMGFMDIYWCAFYNQPGVVRLGQPCPECGYERPAEDAQSSDPKHVFIAHVETTPPGV